MEKDNNNIKRMPYSKTARRERQLEAELAEKALIDGDRRNLFKFLGFTLLIVTLTVVLIYLTTLIPNLVYSYMGVI